MNEEILLKEYQNLCNDVKKVYVVPLINHSFKKTSYLYLLYKSFIEDKEKYNIEIESLSVFAHFKMVFSRLKTILKCANTERLSISILYFSLSSIKLL